MKKIKLTPICPYCKNFSTLVKGSAIYPRRKDLADLNIYACAPCNAYVGTHKGTLRPLGCLADSELRGAKRAAHTAFDSIWRMTTTTRSEAYKWLAKELELPVDECHIGYFDVGTCERVISAVHAHALAKISK